MFCLLLLRRQRCLTTASVDHGTDEQLSGHQSCIAVYKLDTDKTNVEEKRVQRSGGHFDLLGMQIFLYKGRMFAESSFSFFTVLVAQVFTHFLHWVVG